MVGGTLLTAVAAVIFAVVLFALDEDDGANIEAVVDDRPPTTLGSASAPTSTVAPGAEQLSTGAARPGDSLPDLGASAPADDPEAAGSVVSADGTSSVTAPDPTSGDDPTGPEDDEVASPPTLPAPTPTASTSPSTPSSSTPGSSSPPAPSSGGPATGGTPTPGPGTGSGPPSGNGSPAPSPTPAPVVTQPPAPAPVRPIAPTESMTIFEPLRNRQEKFSRYADTPSAQLPFDALLEGPVRPDNGSVGDGQFRAACEYSHFGYDDPIVFPGEPGRSHLHMFFGNTETNAFTTTESLVNRGGGTCNGFELNRSAYWTPALLDGKGNIVVPDTIILYYKSKQPQNAQRMPQGLQMLAGNLTGRDFTADQALHWSCGGSGSSYNIGNRIPNCGGDTINATIMFPNCWDGRNLSSPDHVSHMTRVPEERNCPASHPVRLPQISILLYFPGTSSVAGWHLSSDAERGAGTGPGASLHADWWGGWNDRAMDLWTDGCIRRARNCSFGQTGTSNQLAQLGPGNNYKGNNFLPLPPGSYPR